MKQVAAGLYTFEGLLLGRVYLINDPDGLTLIDTSIRPSGSKILNQIVEFGRSPADVRRIVITHAHPDHVGSLPMLKQVTGAQVITSKVERPICEGQIPFPRPRPEDLKLLSRLILKYGPTRVHGTPVDRIVVDGELLREIMSEAGGMQVITTPGHSPGHISLWQSRRRILISGDVVQNVFRGLNLPMASATPDMAQNIRSIRKLAALEPELICFGHGRPLGRNAAQTLKDFAHKKSNV